MNNMTQFMTICALVAVLYQVTSAAPLTNPQANPNKESRKPANHRREEKRTVTVQINAAEDASLERIGESIQKMYPFTLDIHCSIQQ